MYLRMKFGVRKNMRNGSAAAPDAPAAELEPVPVRAAVAPAALRNTAAESQNQASGAPRIKTYVAESVPHAMTLARSEMGEDAILIQTRRRETVDASKQFEVTFGVVPNAGPNAGLAPQRPKIADKPSSGEPAADPAAADTEVARQLGSLRRELALLQTMLRQSPFGKPALQDNPVASEAYDALLGNDIDADFASNLVRAIEPGEDSPAEAVRRQLAAQIRTDSSVAQEGKAVILMGPPACGKTTALIKLAVDYGLKLGNGIEIFSLTKGQTSVDRTLEAMTGILGVPCEALPDADALESALARPRAKGTLVLVDANGYGSGASDDEMELASLLASGENADVHLVLPATWQGAGIRQTVDRFEIFQPARLLFTMVDQAAVYGPLIQEAWRTGKSLSFIASGTAGRTALRPADLGWIVARLFEAARETGGERD
jgi:flagellar biosynthesis protein FlhF